MRRPKHNTLKIMSKINIKVGEMYYVRVKVTEKIDDKIITQTVSANGSALIVSPTIFYGEEVLAFSPVPYSAPIEIFKTTVIPEAYPKYDPRRKFRKGDKVRSKQVNGRWYSCSDKEYTGQLLTVTEDEGTEDTDSIVYVAPNGITSWTSDPAYLELVTPVEELGPFAVECDEDEKEYSVTIRSKFVCSYPYDSDSFYTEEHAKAAAEAECARLNAEYRKEQE